MFIDALEMEFPVLELPPISIFRHGFGNIIKPLHDAVQRLDVLNESVELFAGVSSVVDIFGPCVQNRFVPLFFTAVGAAARLQGYKNVAC